MKTDSLTKPRKQKSDFWKNHINQWENSGLSQQEYCNRHNLALSTFGYWKRKTRKSDIDTIQFYPLLASAPVPPEHHNLTLCLQDGRFRIEVGPDFSTTILKNLISTLEQL